MKKAHLLNPGSVHAFLVHVEPSLLDGFELPDHLKAAVTGKFSPTSVPLFRSQKNATARPKRTLT